MTQEVTAGKIFILAFAVFIAVASFSIPRFATAQAECADGFYYDISLQMCLPVPATGGDASACEPPNTWVYCSGGQRACQTPGGPDVCGPAIPDHEKEAPVGATDVLGAFIAPAINAVASVILLFVGTLFGIAGLFLDSVITITVVAVPWTTGNLDAISFLWKLFRDIANIGFIFLMLYISIGTILRLDKYNVKQLLVRVVIAALLVNFSLFFTRVIIDASNILTNEFYKPVATLALGASEEGGEFTITGFSGRFMQLTGLTSIYDADFYDGLLERFASLFSLRMAATQFAAALFLLIATFVFIAIALLFMIRFVVFLILMATAPIGFVAGLLPSLKQLADKWWGALWDQAIFAPAFMLLAFVAFVFMDSVNKTLLADADYSFSAILSGSKPESIVIITNFAIAAGLLITALVTAKTLAGKSAGGIVKWATGKAGALSFGVAGLAGRHTLGRAGAALSESTGLMHLAQKGPAGTRWIGKGLLYSGEKFKKSSMDFRGGPMSGLGAGQPQKGGFEKMVKDKAKRIKGQVAGAEEYEAKTQARIEEEQKQSSKLEAIRKELEMAREEAEKLAGSGVAGGPALAAKVDEVNEIQERLLAVERGLVESTEELRKNLSEAAEELSPEEIIRAKEAQGEIDKIEKNKNLPQEKKDADIRKVMAGLESKFTAPGQWTRVRTYMDTSSALKKREKREGDIAKMLKTAEGEKMISSWDVARREVGKELRKDPGLKEKVKKFAKELRETDADLLKGEEGEEEGGEKPTGGEAPTTPAAPKP